MSDFSRDLITGNTAFVDPTTAPKRRVDLEREAEEQVEREQRQREERLARDSAPRRSSSAFSIALAQVERHRRIVRGTMLVALVGRLWLDFGVVELVRRGPVALVDAVPNMGLALLAYLVVLWFLAARTRDRFGFGMALGIGVLQGTYATAGLVMARPWSLAAEWPALVVALAHLAMAGAALHASTAFPSQGGKRPWIVGFATSLVFLAAPWIAPAALGAVSRI